MYKSICLLAGIIPLAMMTVPASAQNFDTSGTAGLTGNYLFRYVNFYNDQYGDLTEACALTGVIAFDGQGNYTTTNVQLYDSASPGYCTSLGGGTYGVQSNGITKLDNPLYPASLFGTFSKPVIIASSTEDDYFDMFIAVQAPSSSVSDSGLSGAFTVGTLDFPEANAANARQGFFTLNADGQGNIAAFKLNGSAANVSANDITQNIPASTYSLSGTTGGTMTIPLAGSATSDTQILSGSKALYVSADGNYILGGSTNGSDIIFGFRAPTGTSSNAMLYGTYFMTGMENYGGYLDAFYGSINTKGDGNLVWHLRYDDVVDIETYDYTFDAPVTIGSNGTYYDGSYYYYLAGANGKALMMIGSGQQFSFIPGVQAPSFTPSSQVWIDPIGITNAASYTPITNSFAPGELVSLYGNFGVSLAEAATLPIPTTLNGVTVTVNGQKAPVFLVSENQISILIPYETSGDYFATFQVSVNGSDSNSVTVFEENSAPGIYTLSENGIGSAAILHANYTEVTASSPAKPGETVLLYMNGLGAVTPTVGDGAAASLTTLSYSNEFTDTFVYLDDGVNNYAYAPVQFAGLAPGFAGLYQVNFTLPTSGLNNGLVSINFETDEAVTEMTQINVSGFAQSNASPVQNAFRPGRLRVPPQAHSSRRSASRRRALPSRNAPL